ncbi:hypothetical protein GOP47_0012911, partial [Adiantum capillus-veneris]
RSLSLSLSLSLSHIHIHTHTHTIACLGNLLMKLFDAEHLEASTPTTRHHSHEQHDGAYHLAVEKQPSSFGGCSCFFFPSARRRERKLRNVSEGNSNGGPIELAKPMQATRNADGVCEDDRWRSVVKEIGSQKMDAGGLFDVKKTERDFKRASLKEKQLTQEAQKLLDMVAKGTL